MTDPTEARDIEADVARCPYCNTSVYASGFICDACLQKRREPHGADMPLYAEQPRDIEAEAD